MMQLAQTQKPPREIPPRHNRILHVVELRGNTRTSRTVAVRLPVGHSSSSYCSSCSYLIFLAGSDMSSFFPCLGRTPALLLWCAITPTTRGSPFTRTACVARRTGKPQQHTRSSWPLSGPPQLDENALYVHLLCQGFPSPPKCIS